MNNHTIMGLTLRDWAIMFVVCIVASLFFTLLLDPPWSTALGAIFGFCVPFMLRELKG